jgi:hypothetical protein
VTQQGAKDPAQTAPLEPRKKISFEQAEGLEPLPSQLKRGEISGEFRAVLWALLHSELEDGRHSDGSHSYLGDPWHRILIDAHVYRDHKAVDDFPSRYSEIAEDLKFLIMELSWSKVLGFLEFALKHPMCPDDFPSSLNAHMAHCHLGYRVFDDVVICPIGTDEERSSIENAFADLAASEFHGARAHLRKAAEKLTAGEFADSVRESIHAVEATARALEPSGALNSALGRLENSAKIHKALKHGFSNLYGYTSDEKGIRHPLLDDGTAKVDETDALFMIGACAAFVSYLINKARTAGLLTSPRA